ncbi:hypothetical protein, partial [Glaesserella parasuis]|uniref:hypothetical protein n=1 Tax=Glaesserella parasuis TaxID=738 RepID=UPI003F2DBFEA
GTTHLSIGSAGLAWEGFRQGVDRPLDIRVADVVVTDGDGTRLMDIPRAAVSLSIRALLLGRIRPRAIEIDRPRLTVIRSPSGRTRLDLGGMSPNRA